MKKLSKILVFSLVIGFSFILNHPTVAVQPSEVATTCLPKDEEIVRYIFIKGYGYFEGAYSIEVEAPSTNRYVIKYSDPLELKEGQTVLIHFLSNDLYRISNPVNGKTSAIYSATKVK